MFRGADMIFLLMWPGAVKWALRFTVRDELTMMSVYLDVGRQFLKAGVRVANRASDAVYVT